MSATINPLLAVLDPETLAKMRALVATTAQNTPQPAEPPVKSGWAAKPKVRTTADQFGSADEGPAPIMGLTASIDPDTGDCIIRIPKRIEYDQTRDTSSRNRRSLVCKIAPSVAGEPDSWFGYLVADGKEMPVEIKLSSTLNLSASALKV